LRGLFGRLAAAALVAFALTSAAVGAMSVAAAPKWVSYLVEPFSLLLMPGLMAAVVLGGPYALTPRMIALVAFGFYFVLIFLVLTRWARRKSMDRRSSR